MARNPESISRVVGQPSIDSPLGGRHAPDIRAPKKSHLGRNIAIMGGRAAAVAAVAFGISQLNSERTGQNPEPTLPGGIVEPSNSPIPTPTMSIELPTPTPTPEMTPTPTPEATATLKPIDTILEGEIKKVAAKTVSTDIEKAYENNPQAETILPHAKMVNGFKMCQFGDPTASGDQRSIRSLVCGGVVINLFKIYQQTGDVNFYKAAADAFDYTMTSLPSGFTKSLPDRIKSLVE